MSRAVTPRARTIGRRADEGADQERHAERRALDEQFVAAYEELRRLAVAIKQGDGSLTLNPTALVNEAWLKLAKSPAIHAASRLHFKRIAARAMRQVLVEAARRRLAGKRRGDGAALTVVTLGDAAAALMREEDLLALDAALDDLARLSRRQALMVESRFFGGLEMAEIATLLEVSEATIQRDWRAARAWLAHALR
jgi:RNA polymerase sigma factor (TIGR02999 family)